MKDEALIELTGIRLAVGKGESRRQLFQDLNLRVMAGETVAIMGESGCGKTTLLSLLGLMLPADHGEYTLNGRNVTRIRATRAATLRNSRIGFIFQSAALLPELNCAENVELPMLYGKNYAPPNAEAVFSMRCGR